MLTNDNSLERFRELLDEELATWETPELISEIAYELWEREGRPDGNQPVSETDQTPIREAHWAEACALARLKASGYALLRLGFEQEPFYRRIFTITEVPGSDLPKVTRWRGPR